MKLCNASGIVYTDIGTKIPFKIENVNSEALAETVKGIKDFYGHKTNYSSMCMTLGTLLADLTQTIAVDFTRVEEFEGTEVMKIDFNYNDNYVPFGKLKIGDTFIYDDSCYMKTSVISFEDICIERCNAVSLKAGYIIGIQPYVLVSPCKLKVVKDYD